MVRPGVVVRHRVGPFSLQTSMQRANRLYTGIDDVNTELQGLMLTPEQVKAARAVAGLGIRDLAAEAGVSPFTITRFETGKGGMYAVTMAKVQAVLEHAGVTFLPDQGEGHGIRWRLPEGGSA